MATLVSRTWSVRVGLVDEHGREKPHVRQGFTCQMNAELWALMELDRLRNSHAHLLGGERAWCYEARVMSLDGRQSRIAYLFSRWEPVEWG